MLEGLKKNLLYEALEASAAERERSHTQQRKKLKSGEELREVTTKINDLKIETRKEIRDMKKGL
jgi:hypothetical protein